MNILFLNSSKEWGGTEKWTVEAACGMIELGHHVYLGCRSDIFAHKAWNRHLQFVHFNFAKYLSAWSISRLNRFIRCNQIDVVIVTKQREFVMGGITGFLTPQVKMVARLNTSKPLHNWQTNFAFCHLFDGVIVNTHSIKQMLAQKKGFDINRCEVIFNGVRIPKRKADEVRLRVRQEFGIDGEGQMILCAGSLTPEKGFDMAIRIFASLHHMIPSTTLVIAGDGNHLSEYQQISKQLGIDEKIRFAGYRNDLSDLLFSADLFWLPSRFEGMPNVLLEAMAHEKTAVAFDVDGVVELLSSGYNGYIIPFGAMEDFAYRSSEILKNPKLRGLFEKRAFESIGRRFTMEKMWEHLEQYLIRIVSDGNMGHPEIAT